MRRPWHIYRDGYARAFIYPRNICEKVVLWFRGWRPHSTGNCWQYPNDAQFNEDFGFEDDR